MHPLSPRTALVFVLFLAVGHAAFARARLHIIRPVRGAHFTVPVDISADGRVIAAHSEHTNFLFQAVRQVRGSRPQNIAPNFPLESLAVAISADGSTMVGSTYNAASQSRGFLWTKRTGAFDLSSDPDLIFSPLGISGNGQVVVGSYLHAANEYRPFVWSAPYGLQPLSIPGYDWGYAHGASREGNVIVGYVGNTNNVDAFACRWINKGEAQLLDPSARGTYATGVTPDGSVIIGGASSRGTARAFHWTRLAGIQWVSLSENYNVIEFVDVSTDGTRIVGFTQAFDNVFSAVLWTAEDGLRDLNELFPSLLPRGWRFGFANAISADGQWIAGILLDGDENYRGYVLDTGRRR